MKVSVATMLLCVTALSGCKDARLEPKARPTSVPANAVWAGGGDGGAYVRCSVDEVRNVDSCTVWNDYTGVVEANGDYRLAEQKRAAAAYELKYSGAINDAIYLEGGLTLKHL